MENLSSTRAERIKDTSKILLSLGLLTDWREVASGGWNIVDLGTGHARADRGV
ncbi:hypothetical protein OKW40_002426 [Paraburkholderia sp. RAU6.4a]|uniref:hypothetical protein n=1 Tax=Paraburkholderia sp. RAU6.4a TaxID=2991067 RepID=UPI003D257506